MFTDLHLKVYRDYKALNSMVQLICKSVFLLIPFIIEIDAFTRCSFTLGKPGYGLVSSTTDRFGARFNRVDNVSLAAEESVGDSVDDTRSELEKGSHEELMYCLGVNLARQLGDITPLTENANELTNVARGVLDTIVGRLSEADQKMLLAQRGKDLNALIVERADNIRKKVEDSGELRFDLQ